MQRGVYIVLTHVLLNMCHNTGVKYYGLFSNLPRDTFEPLEGTKKLHAHGKWPNGRQYEQPNFFLDMLGQNAASRASSVDPLEFQWKPCHSMYGFV